MPHKGSHGLVEHLLVNLRGGLSVAEGDRRNVLQYGHLNTAVAPIEEGHEGTGVHGTVRNRSSGAAADYKKKVRI